jgi:hypothetical protein
MQSRNLFSWLISSTFIAVSGLRSCHPTEMRRGGMRRLGLGGWVRCCRWKYKAPTHYKYMCNQHTHGSATILPDCSGAVWCGSKKSLCSTSCSRPYCVPYDAAEGRAINNIRNCSTYITAHVTPLATLQLPRASGSDTSECHHPGSGTCT